MTEVRYDLVFRGELIDGFFEDFVRSDLQAIFKADQQYIDRLFSGSDQAIKTNVDKATAIKFQQAFKKAGAKLIVKQHSVAQAPSRPAQVTAPPTGVKPTSAVTPPAAKTAPRVTSVTTESPTPAVKISANTLTTTKDIISGEGDPSLVESHQPDIKAPDAIPNWNLSAPGAQLGEPTKITPLDIDTSSFTLAETGADLIVSRAPEEPAPIIDISNISIAESVGNIETLDDKLPPVVVDISHLSVE